MTESGSGFVPNPWYVCFQFFRVIGIGFAVTMSRRGDPIWASRVHTGLNAWAARTAAATGQTDSIGMEDPCD